MGLAINSVMLTSTSACCTSRMTRLASESVHASPVTKATARSQNSGTRSSRQEPTPSAKLKPMHSTRPTAGVACAVSTARSGKSSEGKTALSRRLRLATSDAVPALNASVNPITTTRPDTMRST